MDILYKIFIDPFVQMAQAPDLASCRRCGKAWSAACSMR